MSNKSIGSKIQGLEERLRAENDSRNRDDPSMHNVGGTGPPKPAGPRRPRPINALSNRTRPRHMDIPAFTPVSQDSIETENRLREIQLSGNLTIDAIQYPSDIRDLEHLGELGNGTCGHVVKMLHKPSQAVIAVKQMRRSGNSEENKRILMDLDVVLRSHGCPYIVRCLGCFITEADVWICMELMASCFDKILKRLGGPVPEDILGKVTVATVKALSYLKEEHGVMHRDVKPSNILVDARGSIKLCDFGISGRLVDSKAKTRSAGCAAYMAPERIDPPDPQKPDYDIRADVWSLGISLVELATGIFPYRDCQNDFEVLSKVIGEEPPALPDNQSFSPEFKLFVQQCLTKNYHNRPKYARLLQHPFLQRADISDCRVDTWLATVLPASQRLETPPITRRIHPGPTEDSPLVLSNIIPHTLPQFNGSVLPSSASSRNGETDGPHPPHPAENEAKNLPPSGSNESPKISPVSEHSRLQDSLKSSQESPDQSLSESSKASCISNSAVDQNLGIRDSLVHRISPPVDDCESSSFSSMTVEGDSVKDVNMASAENLTFSKQIEDIENTRIQSPPLEKTVLRIQRNTTPECYTSNGSSVNVPIRGQNYNYTPAAENSPNEYYLQHRVRSFSNTMVYGSNGVERNPPPRFVAGSPNTKNYFANLEIRNQPFSGGGPSSFDSSYTHQSYPHDSGDFQSGFQPQGSPEMARRQAFFSPSRGNKAPLANQPRETHQNVVSPPNFVLAREGYENVPESRFSPNFRTDVPTNYFTSTSVCTMSRFCPTPMQQRGSVPSGYHQNPGGSCSQPASLEAYGETRHYSPYVHARPPEKGYNPALWSPQPVARRSAVANRDREDRERERWRTGDAQHHHPQVQGNTSPIVLQRFYHQQSQRRSRRDLRDGSPRQRSSVSREASVGRSPEPPRRAHRDPSNSRTDGSPHRDQQALRERLERERIPTESHLPDRDGRQSFMDRDRQPDLIRPHQRYERDPRYSHDSREIERADKDRESTVNPAKDRFELRSKNDTYQNTRREREKRDDQNGDCRSDKEDNSDRDNLYSPRERFEYRMQERKNNKEVYHHSRERARKDETNGDVHRGQRDDSSRLSPGALRKHGKSHKDKDDQGGPATAGAASGAHGSRDGHARASRFGGIPRRVADCDDGLASDVRKDGHTHVPGLRYGVPQPPPRRATESWSLPGSPLPARPS